MIHKVKAKVIKRNYSNVCEGSLDYKEELLNKIDNLTREIENLKNNIKNEENDINSYTYAKLYHFYKKIEIYLVSTLAGVLFSLGLIFALFWKFFNR